MKDNEGSTRVDCRLQGLLQPIYVDGSGRSSRVEPTPVSTQKPAASFAHDSRDVFKSADWSEPRRPEMNVSEAIRNDLRNRSALCGFVNFLRHAAGPPPSARPDRSRRPNRHQQPRGRPLRRAHHGRGRGDPGVAGGRRVRGDQVSGRGDEPQDPTGVRVCVVPSFYVDVGGFNRFARCLA